MLKNKWMEAGMEDDFEFYKSYEKLKLYEKLEAEMKDETDERKLMVRILLNLFPGGVRVADQFRARKDALLKSELDAEEKLKAFPLLLRLAEYFEAFARKMDWAECVAEFAELFKEVAAEEKEAAAEFAEELFKEARAEFEELCLHEWLKDIGLEKYMDPLVNISGVATITDLNELSEQDLQKDVGMKTLEARRLIRKLSEKGESVCPQVGEGQNLIFLSHYKQEAGTDARLLKTQFENHFRSKGVQIPSESIFLDSDNLHDLTPLTEQVKCSKNVLVLLSTGFFSRPWCLVEIVTAKENGCNIIPVELHDSSFPFDFGEKALLCNDFLSFLDNYYQKKNNAGIPIKAESDEKETLEVCLQVLEESGIDLGRVQEAVVHILKLIAKPVHLSRASQTVLSAETEDIAKLLHF